MQCSGSFERFQRRCSVRGERRGVICKLKLAEALGGGQSLGQALAELETELEKVRERTARKKHKTAARTFPQSLDEFVLAASLDAPAGLRPAARLLSAGSYAPGSPVSN